MDRDEWMLLVAAIQTIAVLAAAGVAYLAWRTSLRSTEATAQAARASEQATAAAEASARAAEALARIETERRHDELRPRVSLTFKQELDRTLGRSNLFALLANNSARDFRHRATIWWRSGASQHVSSGTLLAGKTERVHVTDLALNGPETLEVVFEPDGWECSCGRGEDHWRLRRTITYGELTPNEEATRPNIGREGS